MKWGKRDLPVLGFLLFVFVGGGGGGGRRGKNLNRNQSLILHDSVSTAFQVQVMSFRFCALLFILFF